MNPRQSPTKLKTALFHKGIPQIALSKFLGVTCSRVSLWANGWERVPQKWKLRISEILQIPMTELFDDLNTNAPLVAANEAFKNYEKDVTNEHYGK